MKKIYLAKKSKRMLARLIDTLILFILTLSTFFALTPLTFDSKTYNENSLASLTYYKDSDLYIKKGEGYFSYVSLGEFNTLESLTSYEFDIDNMKTNVNLLKSLHDFYCFKYTSYDGEYNLSEEVFNSAILLVGNEQSNIKSFICVDNNVNLTLIDEKEDKKTITFVCSQFKKASEIVANSTNVKKYDDMNRKILLSSIVYIFPCLFLFAFILDFIIPVCSKNGETIGKYIFKLMVISKDGYKLKKIYYFPRFLAYFFIEILLSFLTIGGAFLISYTMFLFTKKRRCIHDYLSNSCVVDKTNSFVFDSKELEEAYKRKYVDEYQEEFKNH